MERHVRVGIVADTPLQQHLVQTVIADQGYDVAVTTSPDRLSLSLLNSETVRVWVIDLSMEDKWADFLDAVMDVDSASVIFGDGEAAPERNSEHFPRWRRRLVNKLKSIAPPTEKAAPAPEVNLEAFLEPPEDNVVPLPQRFHYANANFIDRVWVIAASLGGPEPVKEFFDRMPKEIPVAFLYAQHIDAGCVDALVQSIGRHTQLKMTLAQEGSQLSNGEILVVPVDNEIGFRANNTIEIKDNGWPGPYGPSIDHLMEVTAKRYGAKTGVIIFSGMGSDGALGATLVTEAGGQVWSQSTESCTQESMPDSAAATGCVTFRGNAEELAHQLLNKVMAEDKIEKSASPN